MTRSSRFIYVVYALAVLGGMLYLWYFIEPSPQSSPLLNNVNTIHVNNNDHSFSSPLLNRNEHASPSAVLSWPLIDGDKREKLVTFGLYVTPENSPLPHPEKWIGYHTALDLEILPGEENADVPVYSVCDGTILVAAPISGYGGTIVQSCVIERQSVTVLYGHLSLSSFTVTKGDFVPAGKKMALLGKAYSTENGNVRKHLHLGIHKGDTIEYKGYVQTQEELINFIDPLPLFSH